ncbi:unnamed protein product [Victoria cruziana]
MGKRTFETQITGRC